MAARVLALPNPLEELLRAESCPDHLVGAQRVAWYRRTQIREDIKFLARTGPLVHAEALGFLRDPAIRLTKSHVLWLRQRWRERAAAREARGESPTLKRSMTMPKTKTPTPTEPLPATPSKSRRATTPDPTPAAPTGRAGVDWAAAGRKAWETRQRNAAAKVKPKVKQSPAKPKKKTPTPKAARGRPSGKVVAKPALRKAVADRMKAYWKRQKAAPKAAQNASAATAPTIEAPATTGEPSAE